MSDGSYQIAADELRQLVEQYEHLEEEGKGVAEAKKEVLAEVKSRGYDAPTFKKVVALRKRDKDDVAEEEAILDMYKTALNMN